MNKRVLQMGGLAALLVGLTLSMTGCGLIANALSSVNGTIVDARAYGAALSNVLVTLQSVSDSNYVKSDTTDSSGEFSFSGLDSSKQPFEITASANGYFIPPTRVNQNGFSLNIGDIPALKLSSSDLYGLSFITVWNSSAATVDSYLSFPDSDQSGGYAFTTPYSDDFSTDVRANVYYSAPRFPTSATYSSATVYLDYNSSYTHNSSGAGTITMRTLPYTANSYSTSNTTATGYPLNFSNTPNGGLSQAFGSLLDSNTRFRYMGATELYLNAYSGTLNNSAGATTNPDLTVYCIQTVSGPKGSLIEKFTLPEETTLASTSVARVNMFLYYEPNSGSQGTAYQIVPDQRWIPQGPSGTPPFRSVSGGSAIFGVLGK